MTSDPQPMTWLRIQGPTGPQEGEASCGSPFAFGGWNGSLPGHTRWVE